MYNKYVFAYLMTQFDLLKISINPFKITLKIFTVFMYSSIQSSKSFKYFLNPAAIPGDIQSIATFSSNGVTRIVVTSNTSGNKRNGADTVLYFRVSEEMMKGEV